MKYKSLLLAVVFAGACSFTYAQNIDPYSGNGNESDCSAEITFGESIVSSWESGCESDNRNDYVDPYSPPVSYLAKYYTFDVADDTDVQIELNDSEWLSSIYVLNGERGGSVIASSFSNSYTVSLSSGRYTIEVTNQYESTFEVSIDAVNQGSGECRTNIGDGATLIGSFTSDCVSDNRPDDYNDPYSTGTENFRAQYYTFELPQLSDVRFNVNSSTDTYLYLLSGSSEFGEIVSSFSSDVILQELPAGIYTIEVATEDPNTFGNFSINFNVLGDNTVCSEVIELNANVQDEFSPNCLKSSEFGNTDPYSGGNVDPYAGTELDPVRANYYNLDVTELSELKLQLSSSDLDPLINIYLDDGELLDSNDPGYFYGSPDSELTATLFPGSYVIELTAYNELAIGAYTLSSRELLASDCVNPVDLGNVVEGLLTDRCLSQFRGIVDGNGDPYSGNQDPYAPMGDFYARAIEFQLNEPTSVRFSASTDGSSTFLYLAEKDGSDVNLLNQTENNYGSRNEELERHLAPGNYFAEITTAYARNETSFSASVDELLSQACESYIALEEETLIEVGLSDSCLSIQKPSVNSNNDPYAPPVFDTYYASFNTFKVTEAGEYRIDVLDANVTPNIFMLDGPNKNSPLLLSLDAENTSTTFELDAGFYTLESTTQDPNVQGRFIVRLSSVEEEFNTPPALLDEEPSLTVLTAQEVSLNLAEYYEDADNDVLTFSSENILGESFQLSENGIFSGSLNIADIDSLPAEIVITVSDGIENIDSILSLFWQNSAPLQTSDIAELVFNEGETFNYDLAQHFSDVDGQSLIYSITDLPLGLSIDDSGTLSGSLNESAINELDVSWDLNVSDGERTTGVSLLVSGVLAPPSEGQVDCSGVAEYPNWRRKDWFGGNYTHNLRGDEMQYLGSLYVANWYTRSLPGSDRSWTSLGECE